MLPPVRYLFSVISGQTDTEAVYLEVVGEGLAPPVRYCKFEYNFSATFVGARRPRRPDENETKINGYSQYIIYDNIVGGASLA